jgi:uncharacterized OB-fold protein
MMDMWEPRPLPKVTPESERYWKAASNERLLLSKCSDCELVIHYPRARCPDCFTETEWTEASGDGTVYSYSVAERMDGWPEVGLPLIIAYVELNEGPRMITTIIDRDPDDIFVDDSVSVVFIKTKDENIGIPVFK